MKKKNTLTVVILLSVMLWQFSLPIPAETIIVQPNTVKLSLDETVDAKSARQGDSVTFTVIDPVYQSGKLIVSPGAKASGRIAELDKNGAFGKPATLAIALSNVDAVDGSKLPIMANKVVKGDSRVAEAVIVTLVLCIFGLFIKGENVSLQSGYVIDASVLGGSQITLP